jgi:hypothetical protein
MKIHKKIQNQKKVAQKYNLKEILGYKPSEAQKELFFNLAVDKMVNRTANGVDINGRSFTEYSESYAEKKGVSRSAVDLILTGDMLNSFESNKSQPNMVEIKIEGGVNAKKAYNHDYGDTLPKREFFGFNSEDDLADVIREVDSIRGGRGREPGVLDLVALRRAVQETITVEFEGFKSTTEGALNAALLAELRGRDG